MNENINLQNEGNVLIAIFNITTANTSVSLRNLTGLTGIDWGDGVVNIELNHTYSAIGEYTCKIYGVTAIGEQAFFNCDSLTSVVIPDSVTHIGRRAFVSCENLTSVIIPDSVTTIGEDAFYACNSLTSVVFKSQTPLITSILADSDINNSNLTYYVPTETVEAYQVAWAGVVDPSRILPDPKDEELISLYGLRTYHKTIKEKYLNGFQTEISNLAPVAKSGKFEDLIIDWLETEIVFDGGDAGSGTPIALVGTTPLQ